MKNHQEPHRYVPLGGGYGALCAVCGQGGLHEVHRRHDWVNSDLLCMAVDLNLQASAMGDEDDPDNAIRPCLYDAAGHLLLAYSSLSRIS
jgi:hypothetical protein